MILNKFSYTIILLAIFVFFSCEKTELNEPVSTANNLPFVDSSANNSKNTAYQLLLDKYVGEGLPGLVALIKTPDDGLWIGASGYARIEDKTPMEKGSVLYSASVGKTYTSVAIMLLQEEGKLDIDDKMNKYLSKDVCDKIPNGNKVTIRQLLNMSSGIPNSDAQMKFISSILNDPFSFTTKDAIEVVYNLRPYYEPGEGANYSSTNTNLLTYIIDEVTGEPHCKYFETHIIAPLGVQNTYKGQEGLPKPQGLVNGYFDRHGDGKIENVSDINYHLTTVLTGSAGMMATAYDYYVFIEALMKGNLVSPQSLQEMTTWNSNYESSSGTTYGLGLFRRTGPKYGYKIGHDGDGMGNGIKMFYFPEHDITIVTATNIGTFLSSGLSNKFYIDFQDELLDIVFD